MTDKILVVDDESSNRNILSQELTYRRYAVDTARNGSEALEKAGSARYDLIVLDYMMPGASGVDVLKELRKREDDTPVVMITAYGTVDRAVEAMKEGAYDFITKPFEPDHVALVVQKTLDRHRLKRGAEITADEVEDRYRLVLGESVAMERAAKLARKAAQSDATILLLGESGTGKEIFAHNIHNWSERSKRPFVAINSVGLSKELLESELFGHERGAFTGADRLKKGKVEVAHGGTVFLDEIGDIAPELQAKLLRFLEERSFERVGGTKSIAVDIKIIAATNRDLVALVKEGLFRGDLYHRLNVVAITLPPLRQRKEDIAVLSEYFLHKHAARAGKHFTGLSQEVKEKLLDHDWPGNVRELANLIERVVVLGSGPEVGMDDLPSEIVFEETHAGSDTLAYRENVNATRKDLVLKALSRTQGNRAAAAKLLGLESKYFLKLMKSLGV